MVGPFSAGFPCYPAESRALSYGITQRNTGCSYPTGDPERSTPKLSGAAAHKKKADPDKRIEIHDGNGLYVVIQPTGAKSWAYRYRVDGKSRKLTLGTLLEAGAKPEAGAAGELPALSVAEARQRGSRQDAARYRSRRGTEAQGSQGQEDGEPHCGPVHRAVRQA